jgi:hypothetical protein
VTHLAPRRDVRYDSSGFAGGHRGLVDNRLRLKGARGVEDCGCECLSPDAGWSSHAEMASDLVKEEYLAGYHSY